MSRPTAVVIGGSLTGMLSAAVLSLNADVTIVERDVLPPGPEPRKGLPQARHGHLLWSGGVKAIDRLVPAFSDMLVEAGGRRIPVFGDLVSLSPQGPWFRRWRHSEHAMLLSSRDLLDATLRAEVLSWPHITLLQQAQLLGLTGDAQRVTGVRVRRDDIDFTLTADLVIDATGRGSRAPVWLQELGLPAVRERVVDSGVGYATRIFRAPARARTMPIVNVQADPRAGRPGTSGVILPIEGNRWLVTLSGTRGAQPTADPDQFETFARSLRHPIIGELIAGAEPLTGVVTTHSTANRRRYYEDAKAWPEGFVALGDAIATYNPVYGHGMSVSAKSVLAMSDEIASHGLTAPGIARRIQRAAAVPVATAWDLAVTQDSYYEGASDQPPTRAERLLGAYVDRVVVASTRSRAASRALLDVMSMSEPPTRLLSPRVIAAAATIRPRDKRIGEPPLRADELAAAGHPAGDAHRGARLDAA